MVEEMKDVTVDIIKQDVCNDSLYSSRNQSPHTTLVMATRESNDALGDTAASNNYVPVAAAGNPDNWTKSGGIAIAANNQPMAVKGQYNMNWQGLPPQSHKVLENLSETILSIPRLADQGYCSLFFKDCWIVVSERSFRLNDDAHIVAQGYREPYPGGLYRMNNEQCSPLYDIHRREDDRDHYLALLQESQYDDLDDVTERCFTIGTLNTYYSQIKLRSTAERASFYHATFGFPSVSGMYKAISRHLPLPGLTHQEFADNAPKCVHTARGHLHELPQGQGSTKPKEVSEKIAEDPAELERLSTEHKVDRQTAPGYEMEAYVAVASEKGKMYIHMHNRLAADATGNLPVKSYLGHTGIWVAYHPASGYIKAIAFKSKAEVSRMLEYMHTEMIRLGHNLDTVFIDNEIDNDARAYFAGHSIRVNNVAPYNHRANPAERAIGTFKDHFISILSGRDPSCPLMYWNEAVQHAEHTINMLRPGPDGKSAYEAYHGGKYNLDAHPLVPWGTRCESYVPKSLRTTYGYRSQPAFYVGASFFGYRSHRLISMDTEKKIAVYARQQVVFYPHEIKFMRWSEMDDLKERVSDLSKTIIKVHGKTNAKTSNVAEALRAYCDTMIHEDESEIGELRDRRVSGTGPVYWVGPQLIDQATGTVLEEFVPPDDYLPTKVQPPVPIIVAPITSIETEKTPAEMLGLAPESAEPEQVPIIGHRRVSEGVEINTEEKRISEGAEPAPRRVSAGTGEQKTRAQVREDERQQRLNELAKSTVAGPDRINVTIGRKTVTYEDEMGDEDESMVAMMNQTQTRPEEEWHIVQGKTKKIYSKHSNTYLNWRKRGRLSVLKENDHKTLSMRAAMKLDPETVKLWKTAYGEELDRYIAMKHVHMLTPGQRPAKHNARRVVTNLEHKAGKDRRVRATFDGSSKLNREAQYTQYSSDIDTKKIFWAMLATYGEKGARHCTMDIAAFFLHDRNLLTRVEHLFYPSEHLPDAYKAKYASFIGDDGNLMFECGQAVYGMYDAGTIAGRVLAETLTAADYYEVGIQTCMWRSHRPGEEMVCFNINVDDMEFIGIPSAGHKERLLKVLADAGYEVTHTEFSDKVQHFCGYQIVHDTAENTVTVSMPGYVDTMLETFGMANVNIQDHPYRYSQPVFSSKQSPGREDESKPLSDNEIKELQQKLGKLQWYCGICYEIVTIVSKIASAQAIPTTKLLKDVNHVIAYLAGHRNTALFFRPSDMQLSTESDASFASESKSKSRIGGIFLIGGYGPNGLPINSPIGVYSKIADCHPDSAAEAEYVACHDIVKKGVPLRLTLEEFGFPQTKSTENRSDNECAVNMTNDLVMDRKTKHIDRRYHWVRHELKKGTFKIVWYKGSSNLADFFTKLLSKEQHNRFTSIFTKQFTAKEGVTNVGPGIPFQPLSGPE